MKKYIFFFAVITALVFGCTKASDNKILLRIKNDTSTDFKEVRTNNKSFTNVDASATTAYQSFEQASGIPFATLVINSNDTAYAGNIYYDLPLENLENGKYTLRIYTDTSTYYGYGCSYIKD